MISLLLLLPVLYFLEEHALQEADVDLLLRRPGAEQLGLEVLHHGPEQVVQLQGLPFEDALGVPDLGDLGEGAVVVAAEAVEELGRRAQLRVDDLALVRLGRRLQGLQFILDDVGLFLEDLLLRHRLSDKITGSNNGLVVENGFIWGWRFLVESALGNGVLLDGCLILIFFCLIVHLTFIILLLGGLGRGILLKSGARIDTTQPYFFIWASQVELLQVLGARLGRWRRFIASGAVVGDEVHLLVQLGGGTRQQHVDSPKEGVASRQPSDDELHIFDRGLLPTDLELAFVPEAAEHHTEALLLLAGHLVLLALELGVEAGPLIVLRRRTLV